LDIGDDLEILKEGETWRMLSRFWGKKYNVPAVLARANSIPYQARQYLQRQYPKLDPDCEEWCTVVQPRPLYRRKVCGDDVIFEA